MPVTANITNTDIPKTRNGETDVLQDLEVGNFYIDFPLLAAYSVANWLKAKCKQSSLSSPWSCS